MVPEDPTLRRGSGGVLPRHPPVPGVPRPHPLEAGQRLHGGAVHGMGGPHRQGALSRPCHRLPVRCVALCGLQGVHHGAGRAPRAGRLATRRSHKIVSRHGPRSRPSPSPLFPYRRHLARYPAGPGGRGGRASCGHLPRRRGMARPPTATPRLLLPRGPPGLRRRAPRAPRLARLPPRLFCVPPRLSAAPTSTSTPTSSATASSHGGTTSRSPASASPCSPQGMRPAPSAPCPPPGTTSSHAR